MKIAIVHKSVVDSGGAERHIKNIALLLAGCGHDITVYANKCDISGDRRITFHKVSVIPSIPFLKILSFAINSARVVKKTKYDVIIGTGNVYYQDIYFLSGGVYSEYVQVSLLRYRSLIRKVLRHLRRLLSPSHWLKIYIEKKIFSSDKTKLFVCPSTIVADSLIKRYEIGASKIKIVVNGIDTKKFNSENRNASRAEILRKFGFRDSDFVFLFVSSNHFLKGLEPLLNAFYILNKEQKNAKMIVVGKGREKHFKKMACKLNISDAVRFAGWQSDLRSFYKAADFFVYPSFYDPFPNVALESLACGTPLIISSLTGAADVIEEGKNGFVIGNPRNPAEILDKMKSALSLSKQEKENMSACARKTAENLSNEKYIEKITELTGAVCRL